MKSFVSSFAIIALFLIITACGSVKPYYGAAQTLGPAIVASDDIRYSVFMTGGLPLEMNAPVLKAILAAAESSSGLILLGDEVSLGDFPENAIEENMSSNQALSTLGQLSKTFKKFYIVPGEKEWSADKETSSSSLRDLDKLLKDVKESGRLIVPAKECGTPEVVRLSDHTILVLVDSQWAIEAESHPGENMPGCELSNVLELRLALKDIVQSYPTDHILIATHHPIYATGTTAGNYPLSSHLLPVPVVGTIITWVKSLVGSNQHFGHPAYEAYRSAMNTIISGCPNCVVITGHEKSIEYFNENAHDYLVAGSGGVVSYARKGEQAGFSYMSKGYARLDELKNDNLRLSLFAVDDSGRGTLMWQKEIQAPRKEKNQETLVNTFPADQDSILLPASTLYTKKHFLRGEFYRREWSTPLKMPVLRLDQVHGGLKPLQLGGGNQTRSLRMENEKGEQYVLRSIDKKVTIVLPPALRGSFAENIVQDGIAASHPYGALVIPKLAKAADVYYTNPQVVYVPHQAALGIYDKDIGDGVYLFEERPGGNTTSFENFGNARKTYNTADIIDLIAESHENVVDQKAVLRARLLDIWLGDWDRHDDQWRWAAFPDNGVTVYRPIPRDRDQVFYKNDGFLDYLASRPYFNPPLRMFTDKIDHLDGLIWAGKYFDRSFLHELTEDEFVAVAKDMQQQLTDAVIDDAFNDWPKEIDAMNGARIRSFLKSRRDDLVNYAREYYTLLSKEVFIPATADKDVITITAEAPGEVVVDVTRKEDGHNYSFYHRTFHDDVTRELRIFGLNKQDSFALTGNTRSSTLIRIIGGSGDDVLNNQAQHLRVKAYDAEEGMRITGDDVQSYFNNKPFNNTYDRTDWNLNRDFHFIIPTFYTDEGVGLNYTYWWTRYGFRSDPYKSKHSLGLSYFFGHNGFIGKYSGDWLHAFGPLDFGLDVYITGPTYVQYFYGWGNAYVDYGEKKNYHLVSGSQVNLAPALKHRIGLESSISLSPTFQYINIEDENDDPRFVYTPQAKLTAEDFGDHTYVGVNAAYQFSRIDNPGFPGRGISLDVSMGSRFGVDGDKYSHAVLGAGGVLYIPFDITGAVVLATRLHVDKIFGDVAFYHALTLGGADGVRGYRTDRFAGDRRFFQSTDLRLRLFNKQGVVPFQLGVYGSFDYGRVWYDQPLPDDNSWHTAVGGGVYIVPLGLTSFRLGYMVGEKDKLVSIGGVLRLN